MNIKILVCYHKISPIIGNDVLQPILLGAANASEYTIGGLQTLCDKAGVPLLYDNNGEHISELNPYFCELTAMYWAWKNLEADYYGLFHYRRVFDFKGKMQLQNPYDVNKVRLSPHQIQRNFGLSPQYIESACKKADILVSKRIIVSYGWETSRFFNQYEIYARDHHQKDLDIVLEIIRNKYPHYEEALQKVFFTKGKCLSWWNLFVMKKELYFEYCEFLFSVLFEAQKRIDIQYYTPYQQRIYGFLAERLLNVFLVYKDLTSPARIEKYPAWFLKDAHPWLGWVVEGNVRRFYVCKLRVIKQYL
ncbi:DUF4422 domain-containing protein [Helicobacter sp. MIT 21-1697]|uniref:DUF4422 domain-containing protein n=1 Tax=Helicobacter sp. MIT 21-1697 TaxID=2993733 RepID=UPI00224A73E6|nr:DUF4422 domain-containing protein [Helicobacter sp. MIT 21-1697]MCX2717305.1 DUF4422 domain-containing protein [Helicobacter sp. MIT 21-1697]